MNKEFILKANLIEHGLRISHNAKDALDKQSNIWWLRNDYVTANGITLNFGEEYVSVRHNPNSKYELIKDNSNLIISDGDDSVRASVILPPNYMQEDTMIDGKHITDYVTTSTDRIRLLLMTGCANHCKFCNGPVDFKYSLNRTESIDEAFQIAMESDKARHGHISISNVRTEEELIKLTSMFQYFGEKYPGFFDIMMTPRGFTSYTDSSQYKDYLEFVKNVGIGGIAANLELNNLDYLRYYCPEKYEISQGNYLKFIDHAVDIFGVNNVRSLLIVGIEPLEETLKGVEKLAQRGCNPVLSPLYPYGECDKQPSAELLIEVKMRSLEICDKYGIKMGPLCRPCSHNTL